MQYLAVRYTQRLASVGSTGDSYDDLELAVAEYVDWFNHRRLHGEIGPVPPAEFEKKQPSTVA